MPTSNDKPLVIYDHRVRWVAALNMAFVITGITLAVRYGSGASLYVPAVFLGLFSLFWIRDFVFGFRLKLESDGTSLHWQEGTLSESVTLAEIRKVLIGVRQSRDSVGMGWTYVRFELRSGKEQELPPHIAAGLRARKWRHLKRLVAHLRTMSHVPVEQINEPDLSMEGWTDESIVASSSGDVGT